MTCGTWYWFDHCLCLQQFPHICLVTTLSSASWCVTVGLHFHHNCCPMSWLSSSVGLPLPTLAHCKSRIVRVSKDIYIMQGYLIRFISFLQFSLLKFEFLLHCYSTCRECHRFFQFLSNPNNQNQNQWPGTDFFCNIIWQ